MRRLQQRAEEHGHTNLSPLTPQRARFYSKVRQATEQQSCG
ncbi:unnamed protein product [Symbiodinium microadriaticum]|nr:unnamed protein product [Symbiodinium microadriaticum]